jgi:hypothetical protein
VQVLPTRIIAQVEKLKNFQTCPLLRRKMTHWYREYLRWKLDFKFLFVSFGVFSVCSGNKEKNILPKSVPFGRTKSVFIWFDTISERF